MSESKPTRYPLLVLSMLLVLSLASAADLQAKKKKKQEMGAVAGVVMDTAGEVLAGVAVEVRLEAADFRAEAVTDKKGEFRIDVEAQGEYHLKLVKEGYADFETPIYLALGEQQSVQVKLLDAAAGKRSEAVKAYNAGAAAYEARDMAGARQHFEAAVAADPTLAAPFLVLADIYMVAGEHGQAADAAEKFLELEPGDQKGQMLAYEAYHKLGDQSKLDELREALGDTDLAPKLAIQVYNEGAVADQKGDSETAIEKFRAALDFDPELLEAHLGLATVYYRVKQHDQALASIEKLLAGKPDHAPGQRLLYLIQEGRGDRKGAEEAMATYIKADPKGAAGLLYKRADLDFRDGQPDLARAALLKALELDPEMPRAHYSLGKIYLSSDTAKAKQHLQKFIELAPDDPEVQSAKEMLSYL